MSKPSTQVGSSAARRAARRNAAQTEKGDDSDKRKLPRVKIIARVAHEHAKHPLEVENASTLRKQDMMFAILKKLADNGTAIYGEGVVEILQL